MLSANAVQLGAHHHVGPTKDGRSRSVPVPKFVLEEMSRLCVGKGADDLVFAGSSGGYLHRPHSGDGWFAAALRRAGLPSITVHDLAAHMCIAGRFRPGSMYWRWRMLGHEGSKVTTHIAHRLIRARS